jgi:hypothetical protein
MVQSKDNRISIEGNLKMARKKKAEGAKEGGVIKRS